MSISNHQTHPGATSAAYLPEAGRFYRFYSIDVGGRIALAEDHSCDGDAAALALGNKLLSERTCSTIEVWLDKTRIGVIENRTWLGG
ncbi:MAG TPA: hypothetical protein VII20_07855 [Roseiarcus sp.]|jgi:hypothetical protein